MTETTPADMVKQTREAMGLSQGEFAEKLGVHNGSISNWETGANQPKPTALKKLERYYKKYVLQGFEKKSTNGKSKTKRTKRVTTVALRDMPKMLKSIREIEEERIMDAFVDSIIDTTGVDSEAFKLTLVALALRCKEERMDINDVADHVLRTLQK